MPPRNQRQNQRSSRSRVVKSRSRNRSRRHSRPRRRSFRARALQGGAHNFDLDTISDIVLTATPDDPRERRTLIEERVTAEEPRLDAPPLVEQRNLVAWQGLDFSVLYRLFRYTSDVTGNHADIERFISNTDPLSFCFFFVILETTLQNLLLQFDVAIRAAAGEPLDKLRRAVAAMRIMQTGLLKIIGYIQHAPFTVDYRGLQRVRRQGRDIYVMTPMVDARGLEELQEAHTPSRQVRARTARLRDDFERTQREWRQTPPALPDFNSLFCAPDPDLPDTTAADARDPELQQRRRDRRAAFRDALNVANQTITLRHRVPRTAVLLNYTHGRFMLTEEKGFATWQVPPEKTLIIVSMGTPGCVNMLYTGAAEAQIVTFGHEQLGLIVESSATPMNPMTVAENQFIRVRFDAEKRLIYETARQGTPITLITEKMETFLTHCTPTRIAYFRGGDRCLEKYYTHEHATPKQNTEVQSTDMELIHTRSFRESLSPPILSGRDKAYFCLSETVRNVYQRGYDHAVLFDLSCSIVVGRSNYNEEMKPDDERRLRGNKRSYPVRLPSYQPHETTRLSPADSARRGTGLMKSLLAGGAPNAPYKNGTI